MDTTPLYRALIEAGAKEDTAKEAAASISEKISTLEKDVAEVKVVGRINAAMNMFLIFLFLKYIVD